MQPRHLLAIGLIASSGLTLADNEIKAVKVSGASHPSLAGELPTGTLTLDRETLASMPASNLTEVLDTVGGLQASQLFGINGSEASLDLLGFGATANQNTLILFNGRRLSNIDLASPFLSGIPLAAIERIEILPGAGAALYGNGAVGGVINIITRRRYENSAGLEVNGGSYGTLGGSGYATGQQGNLSGRRGHQHPGQRRVPGQTTRCAITAPSPMCATRRKVSKPTSPPAAKTRNWACPAVATDAQFRNDPQGTDTPFDDAEQDNYWLMPGLRIALRGNTALTLEASKRRQQQAFEYVSSGSVGETVVESISVTPKLEGQHTTGSAVHNWTLGLDLNEYDYDSQTSFGDRELEQSQRAWYLHNLVSLTPKLSVSGGARKLESTLSGEGQDKEQDGEMYEGGIRYTFTGNLALFAGAQRSVRIANVDELSPFNPPIDPQTGKGYTAGASWSQGRQHSTLTFWRAEIDKRDCLRPNRRCLW
ncbi:TonB-dependent receptor plug domain-containing protein [Alcanivorax sp.]|uniref:TonB-dependent receptor plug domain-containing protein n=1 Tax=Alcanivorax sp. TaxID=1872427 RepID=UPI003BAC09C1